MNYYKRHIGDYAKKAARLSMLQHGAYTLLMDSCYDREQFPTLDEAIDWCWASSNDEIEAVEFVLSKFFTEEDGVFVQYRVKDELDKYHKNAETNKRIAMEREAKRKENSTKRARTVNEPITTGDESTPNHKPLTTNQEPPTKNQEPSSQKRITKPESFKAFFAAYPPNKKGGTDATAWKKAKTLNLGDEDFKAMLANVQQRQVQCPSWYMQFAKGITRYMEDRDWLTPIMPEVAPRETADQRRQRMIEERNQSLGLTAAPGNGNLFEGEVINHE